VRTEEYVEVLRFCFLARQDKSTGARPLALTSRATPKDSEKGGRAQSDFLGRNMGADLGRNARCKNLVMTNKDLQWWALQGLNLRPLPCEGNALPLS
jgi:hypothetical protein